MSDYANIPKEPWQHIYMVCYLFPQNMQVFYGLFIAYLSFAFLRLYMQPLCPENKFAKKFKITIINKFTIKINCYFHVS